MHEGRQLIQVVPRMTPIRCGVSDGSLLIAGELETRFGIKCAFVALNSNERYGLSLPIIHCEPSQLLDACLSLTTGKEGRLLVHLSGYGYSPDGAPVALADALRRVKADGRFHIAVFFHELFASGMPWKSAFWHSQRQKRAICSIAELCDLPITNTSISANWLEKETRRNSASPILCMPVFSQVGEDQQPAPLIQRQPVVTVFGQGATRQRAYKQLSKLGSILHRLAIREILDIGPESEVPRELSGIAVKRLGVMDGQDVARQLSQATFGFLPGSAAYLAKSGVFAAFCAHGVIPLIAEPFSGQVDGLEDGVHVLSASAAENTTRADLERCSVAAWRWYLGHSLHHHAAIYARWFDET